MVYETYSKRQKRLRGEKIDFYVYDHFPQPLRIQIIHLWRRGLGRINGMEKIEGAYGIIVRTLREEYGKFSLLDSFGTRNYETELCEFFLAQTEPEKILDAIEISFRAMDQMARDFYYQHDRNADANITAVLADLNIRFKEHGLGFEFNNGELMRIDSELIHSEVVKPLLRLLNQPYFKGAEDEYLAAHEHYRHGNTKEALVECLKSFESAMMGICKKRGWVYGQKDTAKTLIDICMSNGLIPDFWQSQLGGLRSMLEGAVPTGRNRLAGHGQGADPTEVPMHLVSYMMHMTASTLKFLAEADEAMPP